MQRIATDSDTMYPSVNTAPVSKYASMAPITIKSIPEKKYRLKRSPHAAKLLPYHIIEIQYKYNKNQAVRWRLDNKRNDSPYLPLKNLTGIQAQELA